MYITKERNHLWEDVYHKSIILYKHQRKVLRKEFPSAIQSPQKTFGSKNISIIKVKSYKINQRCFVYIIPQTFYDKSSGINMAMYKNERLFKAKCILFLYNYSNLFGLLFIYLFLSFYLCRYSDGKVLACRNACCSFKHVKVFQQVRFFSFKLNLSMYMYVHFHLLSCICAYTCTYGIHVLHVPLPINVYE